MSEEAEIPARKVASEHLMGEIRDALLMQVRSMETPWSKLSEDEQADRIKIVSRTAEWAVRQMAHTIAKQGFEYVPAILKDFTVKAGAVKGKFEALVSERNVIRLADHQDKAAIIVLVDADQYLGAATEAKPDPQEPELPIDADMDEAA